MHTLKQKSDAELLQATEITIHEERRVTAKLLEHLREIDRRKLHLQMGYGSLFELLTKKFSYCESGAASRIAAMRLMREVPSVEKALESGALSLTNAAAVQRFFRAEEKRGEVYSAEKKCELTQQLEHHSRLDCEKKLLSLVPQSVAFQRQERVRPVSETQSEIRFVASERLLKKLERLKNLLANDTATEFDLQSMAGVIEKLADIALQQRDPLLKRSKNQKSATAEPKKSSELAAFKTQTHSQAQANSTFSEKVKPTSHHRPAISSPIRNTIWQRANGCCQFVDKTTGKRCESTYALHIDHMQPWARRGTHDASNLQLLCRSHNLWWGHREKK